MKIYLLLFLAFVEILSAPHQLVKFTISSYILPDKSLTMELDVVAPKAANHYTTIVYMTGLSGLLPSYFQSNLIDSVAEQGYIYVTVSKLQSPNPEKITKALKFVMDWISQNLQQVISKKAPGVIADIQNRLVLIGHSAAGHTCGFVKLHILLDGVDGVDPFGIKKDFIITPGKFLPYATPVLVLATELDPHSKNLEPPCGPENLSNTRFYNAMSGPKWYLNVSKYGHADFLNIQYRDLAGLVCATCHKDCNYASYRELVKQAIVNFIDGILNKNAISLSVIQQASFKIPTQKTHNYMGYNPKLGGFCVRVNSNQQQNNLSVS